MIFSPLSVRVTHFECDAEYTELILPPSCQWLHQLSSLWIWISRVWETLNDRSVFVWLTIVMGRRIRHGACTLWHDGVLWKIMQRGIRCILLNSVLQNHFPHFNSMFSVFFPVDFVPVWHPRWTVLLLLGTFWSNSECLCRAPVKMAFICFLCADSSCEHRWPAVCPSTSTHRGTSTASTRSTFKVLTYLCLGVGRQARSALHQRGFLSRLQGENTRQLSRQLLQRTFISPQEAKSIFSQWSKCYITWCHLMTLSLIKATSSLSGCT